MMLLLLALPVFLGTFAHAGETSAASGRIAESTFCIFDCSAGVRPTWPGRCLQPTQVFSTRNTSWLTLGTRRGTGDPTPISAEWTVLSAGNMTWEGWFRVLAPPAINASMPTVTRTSLMGTYGSNHDSQYYVLDGTPAARRRHGAVWIDTAGQLSVTTNAGSSTGLITGQANLADARWHHVAVVWQNDTGGHQITFDFKVIHADIIRIVAGVAGHQTLYADLQTIIKELISDIAKVTPESVSMSTWDDSNRIVGGWIRFGVSVVINEPVGSDISDTELRLGSRALLQDALSLQIRTRIMMLPQNAYPVKPFNTGDIEVTSISMAAVSSIGSVHLYIDGSNEKVSGRITYNRGADHLSEDAQFVVAGGHQNLPLSAEVQYFRLWSRALTAAELVTVSKCGMASAETLFGEAFPHDLHAEYVLDGSYSNSVATDFGSFATTDGDFVRGGRCGYDRCPEASSEGCPLVKNRQLNFNSTEGCNAFATFNFCRRAGQERGRPPYPYFDGCHRGGGNEIADITL